MSEDVCLFCEIISGTIPSAKIYEDDYVIAFNDINPQAPVHILIIPKQHIAGVGDIGEADTELMGRLVVAAKKIADKQKVKEGSYRLVFNNGTLSGQAVFHVHLHLLAGRAFHWPPG